MTIAPLTGDQMLTFEALYALLDATGSVFRLERNDDRRAGAVYEIRLHGKHHAFAHVDADGRLKLT